MNGGVLMIVEGNESVREAARRKREDQGDDSSSEWFLLGFTVGLCVAVLMLS